MLAVGRGCGGVQGAVELERPARDRQIQGHGAGLAGGHGLWLRHATAQGGALAFHGQPAVDRERRIGTGLGKCQIDLLRPPALVALRSL